MDQVLNIGIDVSCVSLDLCGSIAGSNRCKTLKADNNNSGFQKILSWVNSFKAARVQIVMEATGRYHLDLAIFLKQQSNLRVMIANGYAINNFKRARMDRTKTDKVDAETIMEYCSRMEFTDWTMPSQVVLELDSIGTRIRGLSKALAAERCRLHAAKATKTTPKYVLNDIQGLIKMLIQRLRKLQDKGIDLVKSDPEMSRQFQLIDSIPGFGLRSSLLILIELLLLPQHLSVRQLVAYAGLDPSLKESGSSIHAPAKISRQGITELRKALYLPAMSSCRCCPEVKVFYHQLVARGKKKMQALVAVMRKLLHAVYGVLKTNTIFDAKRCFNVVVHN